MTLCGRLGLRRGDVVSVIGAGGKTTLIFRLARELRGFRTLVATTTRMYFPERGEADFLCVGEEPSPGAEGVYFLSGTPEGDPPKATPHPGLRRAAGKFDYALIEADGAKGKPLKGWAAHEPVIIPETTKTLCVLNISALGLRVAEGNIHRMGEFMSLTGARRGDVITKAHLRAAAEAMLSKAAGEKILCAARGMGDPYGVFPVPPNISVSEIGDFADIFYSNSDIF